jgi:hypothetical protein
MKPIGTLAKQRLAAALAVALASSGLYVAVAAQATPAGLLTYISNSRTLHPSVELANLNGSDPRRLGPGTSAALAPDGESVAVVQELAPPDDSTSELLVYPTSGGAGVKLYHCPGFLTVYGWSADSTLILASCPHGLNDSGPLLVIAAGGGSVATIASGVIDGASFAASSSDDVVYALGATQLLTAPVDLYTSSPTGSERRQITHGGISTSPVWGPSYIVFARTTSRGTVKAPINQLWSIAPNGSGARQLTHMAVNALADGLVPLAFSANGEHLLAGFTGTDQSASWAVNLAGKTTVPRRLIDSENAPDAISRDGGTVLLTNGFEGQPTSVESVPWGGGKPTVLAPHGANASWNE